MQVEYEETPANFSTSEVIPPQAQSDDQGVSDDEDQDQGEEPEQDDQEDEEDEEDGDDAEETGPNPTVKTKAKRIIKQRQSLAEKQPGTTIFPISRVKKICKADKELDMMTSEATFMVSVATEYFIKHFMEEGCTKARLDRRKLVTYKDMANVVARSEEFDFLKDVIPLPIPMSEALRARMEKQANDDNPMDDDDETGPLDLTGSDILPPLAHSTNPLFPNAIVKKPSNTHSRAAGVPPASGAGGGAAATKASKAAAANEEREAREAKERERRNAVLHAGPSVQTKPFGAKNAPTVAQSLTTRSRRSLAASDAGTELAEARDALMTGEEVPEQATHMVAETEVEDDRMDQD